MIFRIRFREGGGCFHGILFNSSLQARVELFSMSPGVVERLREEQSKEELDEIDRIVENSIYSSVGMFWLDFRACAWLPYLCVIILIVVRHLLKLERIDNS